MAIQVRCNRREAPKSQRDVDAMCSRSRIHVSRRIQHASTGLAFLAVSHVIPGYPAGFCLLSLATAAFYCVHRRRLLDEAWDAWYLARFGALLRDHERGERERGADGGGGGASPKDRSGKAARQGKTSWKTPPELPGAFYFLLGTAVSTVLFTTPIARTSLLVLSLADPAAGLAGSWLSGRGLNIPWRSLVRPGRGGTAGEGGPTVAGSAACAATAAACTYAYIRPAGGGAVPLASRLVVGAVAAATEAAAGGVVVPGLGWLPDDNLLIPLAVGAVLSVQGLGGVQ